MVKLPWDEWIRCVARELTCVSPQTLLSEIDEDLLREAWQLGSRPAEFVARLASAPYGSRPKQMRPSISAKGFKAEADRLDRLRKVYVVTMLCAAALTLSRPAVQDPSFGQLVIAGWLAHLLCLVFAVVSLLATVAQLCRDRVTS